MKRFLSTVDAFTRRAVESGISFLVLPIIGVVVYEVTARYVFNKPTIWAYDTTWLIFGVYVILAGGYVLLHEGHVRVDVLWARFSPRGKAIADVATSWIAFIFIGTLLWFAIPWTWHYVEIQETADDLFGPPLWPSKIILVIGTFWLLLQLTVKFIRDLYKVMRRPRDD